MQKLLTNIITRDCFKILPEAAALHGVSIKADRRFGFHVVTSPRFICTMNVAAALEEPSGVKVFVKNRPNVVEEFKNMRLLWNTHYAGSRTFHIPEPLHVDEEHDLLFMRYWPGETLVSLLYRSFVRERRSRAELIEAYLQQAAGWLVDFQSINSSAVEKETPGDMRDFEAQLSTVAVLERAAHRRVIDKLRGLERSLPLLKDCYVHDQYLFRNVLYSGGEVCVVDFPHLRTGWPLYDFFTFYTGIERLKQYPLVSGALCDWMKDSFARAYSAKKGAALDPPALENLWMFFLAAYVTKRYKYQKLTGFRGMLNNHFVRRMFDKLAAWSRR